MYGLPEDFDPSFFIKRRLELVCFSENTLDLHFDGEMRITIESALAHQRPEPGASNQPHEVPVLSSELMQLLGVSIIYSSASADGTLSLTFENGHKLQIFDTSSQYESYKIEHNGIVIIV